MSPDTNRAPAVAADAAKEPKIPVKPERAEAEQILGAFQYALEYAAGDERLSHRLSLADATVEIELSDAPGDPLALTLLLDRSPIEVVEGAVGDPEVRISISTREMHRWMTLDLHLAIAIAHGSVGYEGPVRKFLRVVPIIRSLGEQYDDTVRTELIRDEILAQDTNVLPKIRPVP